MADTLDKIIDDFIEGKIIDENLEDIMGERFGRYSKYIIQDRALPDVRDGLKPVQRRILYAMHRLGLTQDKPYKKSARIVGDVIGKYHPHGDSSVYEAIVRMSQDFKMREILIDMHGNNGSIDGDSAAAMRYTEARMSKVSEFLLQDIDKYTVDYAPNFDDEEYEPIVLPARFPNLIVNGASGISAGYATEIPPHNIEEVIKAIIKFIDKPALTTDELLEIMPGPDFPTGAIVQGEEGIRQAFETGKGRIKIKSNVTIEDMDIVITEIPYETNKASLVRAMDEIRLKRKVDGIKEVRDESSSEGLRVVVEVKKSFEPEAILNFLHKKTDLTKTYTYNMVAINNKRPQTMSVFDIFNAYIYHQKEVVTNRANHDMRKAKHRLHIVEGIIYMVDILDEVIALIRKSASKKDAKTQLTTTFVFTEEQAEAILTLQLYRLSHTDLQGLKKEKKELEALIEHLNDVLSNENTLEKVIKKELRNVIKAVKTPRRSQIEQSIEKITVDEEALIESESVAVAISKDGYVKQASLRSYKATDTVELKENDAFIYESTITTHHTLLIFTSHGNYVFLPVYKIPQLKWKELGHHLSHFAALKDGERIVRVFAYESFNTLARLLFTTKQGLIKQTDVASFEVQRYQRTFNAVRLNAGDILNDVREIAGDTQEVMTISAQGHALRFDLQGIPVASTTAKGVKAMQLSANDTLATTLPLRAAGAIAVLTNRGTIKRIDPHSIQKKRRSQRGSRLYKPIKTNPYLVRDAVMLFASDYKHRAPMRIITTKAYVPLTAFAIKPTQGEHGKSFISKAHGEAQWLLITRAEEDETLPPLSDYTPEPTQSREQVSLFNKD